MEAMNLLNIVGRFYVFWRSKISKKHNMQDMQLFECLLRQAVTLKCQAAEICRHLAARQLVYI